MLLQLLGASAHGGDIDVAALGAGAGHAVGGAAVVAAQGAVDFVEHAVGAAMRALALPAAIAAMQYGRKATAVEEKHGLLATGNALGNRV